VDIVIFKFLVGLYRELWKIGWAELDAISHSGRVATYTIKIINITFTMYTVNESAVCTSPTENSNFGGGYKVTAVTSGELVVLPCEAIKLLTGSEWGRTKRHIC